MRLRDLAEAARRRLVDAGIAEDEAGRDAELLLRDALGWDRAVWLTRRDQPAAAEVVDTFERSMTRRAGRAPVAYIRGEQEFYGRPFHVGPGVLIPRPETELVVDEALASIAGAGGAHVLDIGTGSGCLAVTLALEAAGATVDATDVSADALAIARQNAARHAVSDRVRFVHGAGVAGLTGPYDLVVSNPPYVPETDAAALQPEVVVHEPHAALFAGADGLDVIRAIVAPIHGVLREGGTLAMEIGIGQAEVVMRLVREAGFASARMRDDLQGIPRLVVARR